MYSQILEKKIYSKDIFQNILNNFSKYKSESEILSFVNPYSYMVLKANLEVIKKVDYWFCDGYLLCFLSNLIRRRGDKINRTSFDFSSIANLVFEKACLDKLRIVLIGGNEKEVNLAKDNLIIKYHSLQIVAAIGGYFKESKLDNILDNINSLQPDIVIVGMGTPKQEIISYQIKCKLTKGALIFTCGGFITQTSISLDFYNNWSKNNFRWLQRAIMFKHVRRRLIKDYPVFVIIYLFDVLMLKTKFKSI